MLVIDNSTLYTQLLRDALSRERGIRILPPDVDVRDPAVLALANVAVVSSVLEGVPAKGCSLISQLRALQSHLRSILLVDCSTREVVLQAFRSGAQGIFCRSEPVKTLAKAIRRVHGGHVWATQRELHFVLAALMEPIPVRLVDAKGATLLSNREQDVVRWVAEGLTNREIANRLDLSEHTVKNYLFRIFDKLGVSSRIELILYALSQAAGGRIDPSPAPTATPTNHSPKARQDPAA